MFFTPLRVLGRSIGRWPTSHASMERLWRAGRPIIGELPHLSSGVSQRTPAGALSQLWGRTLSGSARGGCVKLLNRRARSVRLRAPVLASTLDTWRSIVLRGRKSLFAISGLLLPAATRVA